MAKRRKFTDADRRRARAARAAFSKQTLDVSVLGVPGLQRKLNKLETAVAKKIVRKALRNSAKRIKKYMVQNMSGAPVDTVSGNMLAAFKAAKIRSSSRRGITRVGPEFPTNEALGITTDENVYYPIAVEFGHAGPHPAPARPFIRPAVDENATKEKALIAKDIQAGINKET